MVKSQLKTAQSAVEVTATDHRLAPASRLHSVSVQKPRAGNAAMWGQSECSSPSSRLLKHPSIDSSDPELEWADTSCLSELTESLQRRMYDQGHQIAQLRAELSSRTRVAAAFSET